MNHEPLAAEVGQSTGFAPYESSITEFEGTLFFLGRRALEKRLCLAWPKGQPPAFLQDFCGERLDGAEYDVLCGRLDHMNAAALRKHLPWTGPQVLGLRPSIGLGDRFGIATPAHIRAVRGSGLAVVLAQQSIREMQRTGRTPDDVMDTATFGVFQEGYRDGFGADADHLKTTEDIDLTAAAGFTMFTIDPGDHVHNAAQTDDLPTLEKKFAALPLGELETSHADLEVRLLDHKIALPDGTVVVFDRETLLRAAVKYGRALVHTLRMYRHLAQHLNRPFDFEVSVDETATPTSIAEHVFIANELQRTGVLWVSLAPRFVGEFEKGVDYIGDLQEFARTFAQHVAVAKKFGPYKISIHSGSDKFSIYPVAAGLSGGMVHLKTAGTSYLEALRAIAKVNPGLFRELMAFALERYPEDRASYHVSAKLDNVPAPESLSDDELPAVLDQFDTREVMHVTFGSVLRAEENGTPRFKDRFMQTLMEHEEAHYETVRAHIARHVKPFAGR